MQNRKEKKQKSITNIHDIDLALAVWAVQDNYDSGKADAPKGELISVTSLMKPTRMQILQRKIDHTQETIDVSELIAKSFGQTMHKGIEEAWTDGNWQRGMKMLGFPDETIAKVKINPDPNDVGPDDLPVWLEQRGYKKVGGIVLTGQQDFCIGGAYRDTKTTSTYGYTSDSKDQEYILQGSLYRYVMPEFIWKDTMRINFLFTDWLKYKTNTPGYPQAKAAYKVYDLMSLKATEDWILNKIASIKANAKHVRDQSQMIRCTDEELWISENSYKYYSNPETAKKKGRSTKNFKSLADAQLHKNKVGKGVVVTVPGQVKRCPYCPAFSICQQRKEYFKDDGAIV